MIRAGCEGDRAGPERSGSVMCGRLVHCAGVGPDVDNSKIVKKTGNLGALRHGELDSNFYNLDRQCCEVTI